MTKLTEDKESVAIGRVVESTLRYKDYIGMQRFFSDIWKAEHSYIAVLARRCFNLEHLFAEMTNMHSNQRERIISNNALLLYADQIAKTYIQEGMFPSILIVDDLLIHGRGMGKLLYQFEELVTDAIMKRAPSIYESIKYGIHWDLIDAIDIYIYAVNKEDIILDSSFARKIKPYGTLEESNLRELSQRLSRLLERIGVPNTSYVISQKIIQQEVLCDASNGWNAVPWDYHGNQYQVFIKCDCPSEPKLIATLRMSEKSGSNEDLPTWITSTAFFGNLKVTDMEMICTRILEVLLQNAKLRCVRRILGSQQKILRKQCVQFLSFLLSVCFLYDFSGENQQLIGNSDLTKICRNFAKFEDIYSELVLICQDSDLLRKIRKVFIPLISERCESIFEERFYTDLQNPEYSNNLTEDIFYEIGMQSERAAYEIETNLRFFHPLKQGVDTIQTGDFVREWEQMQERYPEREHMSIRSNCIPSMLALMDSGLMSMNVELDDGELTIRTVLKAGEMALFSLPRRLRFFIPALALVERDFWRVGLNRLEAVKEFMEFLCATTRNQKSTDRNALDYLKKSGSQWAEQIYSCGQSFRDWEIDLSAKEDWMTSPGTMSYLEYIQDEIKKQNMYLEKAKFFLRYAR